MVEGAPKPTTSRARPFQWNLLAWAALVGTLTGFTIVGFHLLLGFINNFLYGPFVEGLLEIARSPIATAATSTDIPLPPLEVDSGTPLKSLLQLGLDGIGFLAQRDPAQHRRARPCPAPLIGWLSGRWSWCPPWAGWQWGCCAG